MKRIFSVVLLLAMVIGCFAGCAPKEDAALTAAKDYLYAMFKDGSTVTSNDFTMPSQVIIEDKTFPITWTTDAPAENVKITAGENKTTTIAITAGEKDINYKLTGTLANEEGMTAAVTFEYTIPAKAAVGGAIVLTYPKENKYVTGVMHLYKTKYELVLSENKADAVALTVVENGDDTISLKAGDQYLYCDANTVEFKAEQGDNTKFVLEAADTDGGYFIKCAVANYNGKAQYLEVYSGYLTCYGMGSDPSIYTFKMEDATGANGSVAFEEEEPAPENPPATNPPATNPPATNPPATNPPVTNPPAVSTGASLTLDLSGVTMAAEGDYANLESDAILAALQAGASGAGLVSAEGTKVYAGNNNNSGAFPMSGGNFKVGSSKNDGQLVLKFSKKVAKVEIVCHDWYAKSAEHPTNSNTLAVNGSATQLAPYTETPTAGTLTFALDGSSDTVTIDVSKRAFVFKIVVTFVA